MSPAYYDDGYARRYRPGRGGFDPEAAAVIARAKYAFRQRVVLAMIIGAIVTAVVAAVAFPSCGGPTAPSTSCSCPTSSTCAARSASRTRSANAGSPACSASAAPRPRGPGTWNSPSNSTTSSTSEPVEEYVEEIYHEEEPARRERVLDGPPAPVMHHGNAVLVDVDDEDPAFDDLDEPGQPALPPCGR